MVRDAHGRKMSKSKGNVIDPLEVIYGATLKQLNQKLFNGNLPAAEIAKAQKGQAKDFPNGIPECGTDALRFGLLEANGVGKNVNLNIRVVEVKRQFCNKMWQATRFMMGKLEGFTVTSADLLDEAVLARLQPRDQWILDRLNAACAACDDGFVNYHYSAATQAAYDFFLRELCDVYIELTKPIFAAAAGTGGGGGGGAADANDAERDTTQRVLWTCLDRAMRLFHPFMPFVTEELWQRMPGRGVIKGEPPSIMLARCVACWRACLRVVLLGLGRAVVCCPPTGHLKRARRRVDQVPDAAGVVGIPRGVQHDGDGPDHGGGAAVAGAAVQPQVRGPTVCWKGLRGTGACWVECPLAGPCLSTLLVVRPAQSGRVPEVLPASRADDADACWACGLRACRYDQGAKVHILAESEADAAALTAQANDVVALVTGVGTVEVQLGAAGKPEGCASCQIKADLAGYVELKGIVDPAKEIAKKNKQVKQLEGAIKKCVGASSLPLMHSHGGGGGGQQQVHTRAHERTQQRERH